MQDRWESGAEQKVHWNETFADNAAFFGEEASELAKRSVDLFRREGVRSVLELGCGQGRDTVLFAQSGFAVTALDYAETALAALRESAQVAGISPLVYAQPHDVKEPLPFPDHSFDACFAHMLLCMELSTGDIASLLRETHRVLKPEGVLIYSVRSTFDPHFQAGEHLGEDLYRIGGFVVHFFTASKIRQIAQGYDIVDIDRFEEGALPRDLFAVTLRKAARPKEWDRQEAQEKKEMNDPMGAFQQFLDASMAPGALDQKTKQLVALGAALAVGCDSCLDYGLAAGGKSRLSAQEIEEVAAIAMAVNAQKTRSLVKEKNSAVQEYECMKSSHDPRVAPLPGRT